jgi:uncharacterized protein (TIGR02594 family)
MEFMKMDAHLLPEWMVEARKWIGLKEIPGKDHNPTIINWLTSLKAWWRDDETPWCGTFVAHCLRTAGIQPPKDWYRAKAYADFGYKDVLKAYYKSGVPVGAIGVKSRTGGGHVFFVVSNSLDGNFVYGLGGNQNNSVSIAKYPISSIDTFVYPIPPSEIAIFILKEEFNSGTPSSEA